MGNYHAGVPVFFLFETKKQIIKSLKKTSQSQLNIRLTPVKWSPPEEVKKNTNYANNSILETH